MNKFLIPLLFLFAHCAYAQGTISVSGVLTITQVGPDSTYIVSTAVEMCEINDRPLSLYVEQDESVIQPAPGFRSNLYYWNGKWWQEYDYLKNPEIDPLCILQYFSDGETERLWLTNVRMSNARFKRVSELFKDEKFYAPCCATSTDVWGFVKLESMDFVAPGPVGKTPLDLPTMQAELLQAILKSRK